MFILRHKLSNLLNRVTLIKLSVVSNAIVWQEWTNLTARPFKFNGLCDWGLPNGKTENDVKWRHMSLVSLLNLTSRHAIATL